MAGRDTAHAFPACSHLTYPSPAPFLPPPNFAWAIMTSPGGQAPEDAFGETVQPEAIQKAYQSDTQASVAG